MGQKLGFFFFFLVGGFPIHARERSLPKKAIYGFKKYGCTIMGSGGQSVHSRKNPYDGKKRARAHQRLEHRPIARVITTNNMKKYE